MSFKKRDLRMDEDLTGSVNYLTHTRKCKFNK